MIFSKNDTAIRILCVIMALLLLSSVFPLQIYAETETGENSNTDQTATQTPSSAIAYFGIVNSDSYIRYGPSTSGYEKVSDKNGTAITLAKGIVLHIIDQVKSEDPNHPNDWYKVRYIYMATGEEIDCYIYSDNVTKRNAAYYISSADTAFETSIADFPEGYKPFLRALHEVYPNWKFTPYNTGIDFKTFVALQAKVTSGNQGENTSYSSLHYTRTNPDWRKGSTLVDGKSWYHASDDVVAYYLDPRNFLNEVDIFQFESIAYNESIQGIEGVESLITGTFMENKEISKPDGTKISYAEAYMEAAKQSGVSPYSLVISTILENGKSGTKLTSGSNKYYNYFGIGSVPGGSPQQNGLNFAQTGGTWSAEMKQLCMIPWDSAYKAIVGGAIFMGKSYISIGQNTSYYKRFDVFSMVDGTYIHQYMQDIEYPVKEAFQAYNNYTSLGLVDHERNFVIPVYNNMPQDPPALPGTTPLTVTTPLQASAAITATSYNFTVKNITKIKPGTTVEQFKQNITLAEGAQITISNNTIGTGTSVKLFLDNASTEYKIVIRGDISGDGEINTVDMLILRDYILGTKKLSDEQLIAADVDGKNGITMADMLQFRNAMLDAYEISQEIVT